MKKIFEHLYNFFVTDRNPNDNDLKEFARIEFNKDQDYAFYWLKNNPKKLDKI